MTRFTPLWEQAGNYSAAVDRRLIGALWPTGGQAGCLVTLAGGMVVNIAPGQVAVPAANNTGSLLCTSDAVEQVTLDPAPPAGNDRWDIIICKVRGNDIDGGANNDFIFDKVTGTPAPTGTPTVPATPPNAVPLAQIAIHGGAATPNSVTLQGPGPLAPTAHREVMHGWHNLNAGGGPGLFDLGYLTLPSKVPCFSDLYIRCLGRSGYGGIDQTVDYDMRTYNYNGIPIGQPAVQTGMFIPGSRWLHWVFAGVWGSIYPGDPVPVVWFGANSTNNIWFEAFVEWSVYAR